MKAYSLTAPPRVFQRAPVQAPIPAKQSGVLLALNAVARCVIFVPT